MPTSAQAHPRRTARISLSVEALEERWLLDAGPSVPPGGHFEHPPAPLSHEAAAGVSPVTILLPPGFAHSSVVVFPKNPTPREDEFAIVWEFGVYRLVRVDPPPPKEMLNHESLGTLPPPPPPPTDAARPGKAGIEIDSNGTITISAFAAELIRDLGLIVQMVSREVGPTPPPAPAGTTGPTSESTPAHEVGRLDRAALAASAGVAAAALSPALVPAPGTEGVATTLAAAHVGLGGRATQESVLEVLAEPAPEPPTETAPPPSDRAFPPQTANLLLGGITAGTAALDRAMQEWLAPLRDAGGPLARSLYWVGTATWVTAAALAAEGARRYLVRRRGETDFPADLLPEADL
jgi:hypothetical protein